MRKYDEENSACLLSHPVRGAWIEILQIILRRKRCKCRTPSGVRGLKWKIATVAAVSCKSHPVRGAWIEMQYSLCNMSRSSGSHPVRGAWIEIAVARVRLEQVAVAPRQGCVD